jgi:hypothetical protein
MTAFTDVTDKMTDKLFDVTDLMADKLVVGIDKGLDVAAAVSDKTKELFTSTPSAAADATSENPEHTTHPAHAQSTPETLVPTDSIQPAHVAVEISTGAPSDAAPVAVLADKDLQPLRKKRTSVVGGEKPHRHRRSSTLVSADGSVPSGEHKKKRKKKVELQDTSRVGQLLSKFTPIVSRVTGAVCNDSIQNSLSFLQIDLLLLSYLLFLWYIVVFSICCFW